MIIFDGKKEADKILSDLNKRIREERLKLKLAVISVGEDEISKLFIRNKEKAAKKIGVQVEHFKCSAALDVIEKINALNRDVRVNGIIVQLPLPDNFDADLIVSVIDPKKDIDGFHKKNLDMLEEGKPFFFSPLSLAILNAMEEAIDALPYKSRKKISAIVNSDIFGKSLKIFFKQRGIKIDYFFKESVSRGFSGTLNDLKKSDIIITVCGHPNLINGDMIKKGVVLIDGGVALINISTERGERKILIGDINRESVNGAASFLTPVPGGIGPLTIAFLLKNVYFSGKGIYGHN